MIFGKKKKETITREEKRKYDKLRGVVDAIIKMGKKETDQMTKNYDRFAGKIWNPEELDKHDSRAFINYEFSTIQGIAPMLTDNPPIVKFVPKQSYLSEMGAPYNNALKYFWQIGDMQMKIFKAVLDAMIAKIAYFKIYYNYEKDQLDVDIIDPRTFFGAPGYDEVWDMPLCGTVTEKPLDWIHRRFPDAEGITSENSWTGDEGDKKAFIKFGDVSDFELCAKFARVYEIWVKDEETEEEFTEEYEEEGEKKTRKKKRQAFPHGKWVYLTKTEFLAEEKIDWEHNLPPFVELKTYIRPHNLLGISECDNLEGLNKEVNLMLQHIVGYVRKYAKANKFIDVNQLVDWDNYKETHLDGDQVYPVDSQMARERPPVEVETQPVLNAAIPALMGMLIKFIEEASAHRDVNKGEVGKKDRQSASEIALLYESGNTRTRQKVRNLDWTIKRVCYILGRLMQQYYSEIREFYTRDAETGEAMYDSIGNSRGFAESKMQPQVQNEKQMTDVEKRQIADYEKLIKTFGEKDPVYFDFDVEVEDQSTLPMDKQSKANMFMRLRDMKAMTVKHLLIALQIPNAEEIAEELEQQERPPGPQMANPGNPQDMAQFNQLAGGQNG